MQPTLAMPIDQSNICEVLPCHSSKILVRSTALAMAQPPLANARNPLLPLLISAAQSKINGPD